MNLYQRLWYTISPPLLEPNIPFITWRYRYCPTCETVHKVIEKDRWHTEKLIGSVYWRFLQTNFSCQKHQKSIIFEEKLRPIETVKERIERLRREEEERQKRAVERKKRRERERHEEKTRRRQSSYRSSSRSSSSSFGGGRSGGGGSSGRIGS